MRYNKFGSAGAELSIFGLGGHEYLPDGRSRAFNEDSKLAVTPGYLFDGFGQDKRKRVLAAAIEHGINFFDATVDSEKEALGRNLRDLAPPYEIYVQTRPEGMVYTYDPFNQKMVQYDLLKAEVQRGLALLQRERLDFFNVAFMQSALDHDPAYLDKIAGNVARLKQEGLIRFACADTFSGEATYLAEIETGCFDAVYINFNPADDGGRFRVLPEARARGMGVFCREAFMKGALFKMGGEVGLMDRGRLAQVALKWVLSHKEVTLVMVGVDTPEQLAHNVQILDAPVLNADDLAIIEQLKLSPTYENYAARKARQFGYAG
ncbi:MAG: aldo/keto reductase [Anaerolineae bacterium]|nr:aldo/keto reductase [Anaerolineae bacterium]